MTEREKAHSRAMIVGLLVAMLVVALAVIGWQELNEPMTPQVIELRDHTEVRWGNRFKPFTYRISVDGIEKVRIPGIGLVQIVSGQQLSPEAHRRLHEGRAILKELQCEDLSVEKATPAAPP